MLDNGLLDEARRFYRGEFGDTASAAIGYKELLPYLNGESDLETCVENLKRATRRYAKRQLTWFRRDPDTCWFNIDELSFEELRSAAIKYIRRKIYEQD